MIILNSIDDVNRIVGSGGCRLVVIRFGDESDPLCIHMDSLLERISFDVSRYIEISRCERSCVKDLIGIMNLDSPLNIMCFFNGRHIKIDCGSGDNEKIDFMIRDEETLIELFTLAYKAGVRGKGLVRSSFRFW